ncbi:putative alpha-galactosidase [Rhizoctonia solani AG-1 IB]|uniref:Alpha-galactosidase n=1 Tax=Thanatephorus cucumeris (strain AG1-IB / isolate 7/3/14) TaxID=1108050 RepID=M5C6U2_THACB|nr:putative alpha-galactosidase [Rhizoctonia solani AG-1 IB]
MLPLLSVLGLVGSAQAANNGLARTPQMGWNTWNKFACDISEDLILSAGQAIVDNGLKDLGYEYVVVDDCKLRQAKSYALV